MKKLISGFLIAVFASFMASQAFAQSGTGLKAQGAYKLSPLLDIPMGAAALGLGIAPFFIENKPSSEPVNLDKSDINIFDRPLRHPYLKGADLLSNYGGYAMLVLPVLSLAGQYKDGYAWLTYGAMYGEAFMLTMGMTNLLKNTIIRWRPYMYDNKGYPSGKGDDYYNSFPSGSTAYAFLSATFLSVTFAHEYPDSNWRVPVIAGSYALAAGVGMLRVASGAHFPTDVLVGGGIGALFGALVPFLHERKFGKYFSLSLLPSGAFVKWAW
jgi:membrane-associated phospholipid phosphatase